MKFVPFSRNPLTEKEALAASEEFYELMRSRRTVRDFSPDPIPEGVVENAILTAGTAPNGANLQPWHFAIVKSAEVKRQIREAAEEEEREFYQSRAPQAWLDDLAPLGTDAEKPFLEVAPVLIVIFQKNKSLRADGREDKTYYPKESVGIATGMLISALHQAGLATLTHTPSPMAFLNQILERPSTEKPFVLLVVGYPAEGCQVPQIEKLPFAEITSLY
ncbi:nitroreductase family protein [Roseibacillus persicicus]|uniref:Oxidoreductase n=1 Tax=Roseibacillus persicicus TaxID=454148 RepID=A0A918TJ07_9BACT|nr:nitroreductase family protein [Roseibacillus persicicus]GHC49253.1 oxidoreductase [Roseibacillus persicicus]